MLRVLDLFSGIGGFSLGLERTGGFKTVAFCEIEEFPRRVLAKHWPGVPIHQDVRTLKGSDVEAIDVICGGFPCQDISFAGRGAGIQGQRSGLWREYARLIGEVRPRFVIVENVAALLGRGLDVVLGDLAALRYNAWWDCIPAAAIGAPHIRDRLWLVAFAQHPDADGTGSHRATVDQLGETEPADEQVRFARSMGAFLANAARGGWREGNAHTGRSCEGGSAQQGAGFRSRGGWATEPDVGRVAHGVPARVDRLRGLGNAVVPQIPEIIGRAILAAEAA